MKKVLVIVGPTAIGKTSFSVECAKKINGEIISGDSIQVYKGLDIGSGKVREDEKQGIPHYCIDILDPKDHYSVYDFQKMGRELIDEITNKNKLPIVCGGTGLYIKALVYDYIFDDVEIDVSVNEHLTNEELYEELQKLDPKCLDKIHVNNRKRLLRALALAQNNHSLTDSLNKQKQELLYDTYILGLTSNRDVVYDRINRRVKMMIDDGLVDEIKGLLNKGITFDDQAMQGIGYREFKEYFENNQSLEETISLIQRNTRRFAKRQYTYFNNQLNIHWFDIKDLDQAMQGVLEWIKN